MEENAYKALAHIKQIANDAKICVSKEIPFDEEMTKELNNLAELAYIVEAYHIKAEDGVFARKVAAVPRHIFSQLIAWRKLESETMKSVARCYRILYNVAKTATANNEPHSIGEPFDYCSNGGWIQSYNEAMGKYFPKAIEKGWMEKGEASYKWKGSRAELAYFCGRVFCTGNKPFPGKALKELFGVGRLQAAYDQAMLSKKPQAWRNRIDSIFD